MLKLSGKTYAHAHTFFERVQLAFDVLWSRKLTQTAAYVYGVAYGKTWGEHVGYIRGYEHGAKEERARCSEQQQSYLAVMIDGLHNLQLLGKQPDYIVAHHSVLDKIAHQRGMAQLAMDANRNDVAHRNPAPGVLYRRGQIRNVPVYGSNRVVGFQIINCGYTPK